jgi:hypothetical protein
MDDGPTSYLHPSLEVRFIPHKRRYGIVARLPILAGTPLTAWGGWVVPASEFLRLTPDLQRRGIQIEESLFLIAPGSEPSEHFNHSCDPNAEMSGQVVLLARRDIAGGEEVCFDYAMVDVTHYDEFDCDCGSPGCRGRITGDDWRRPELWARYGSGFSPFLMRRIARLAAEVELENGRAAWRQVERIDILGPPGHPPL